jgi:hypothetical protein
VACEVDHERPSNAVRDAAVGEQLHHVEQVARVLPVHGGDQLAAVDVVDRHHRNLQLGLEHLLGLGGQPGHRRRPHGPAHHVVDLDLDLDAVALHQQLGLAGRGHACEMGLESPRPERCGGLAERGLDGAERRFTRQGVVRQHQVQVDRQARHVPHEKIDGRATLERKGFIGKDKGGDLRQQARGLEVDVVHDLRTSKPSSVWETHALLPPVGSFAVFNFFAHGNESSCPRWRHRRTVFTFVHWRSNSPRMEARRP